MIEFIDIPTEQTTAVTDILLALVALGCALYLWRIGRARDRYKVYVWSWAFGLLTLASALGAVAHGIVMSTKANDLLWQPINLALGLTISLFVVGVVHDAWGWPSARRLMPVLLVMGVAFFVVTRLVPGTFLVFILYEAVAMLFALGVYLWLAARRRLAGAGWMAAGILITIIAAGIQASNAVLVRFVWEFDHNGVFHLVQIVGVIVLTVGLCSALLTHGVRPDAT